MNLRGWLITETQWNPLYERMEKRMKKRILRGWILSGMIFLLGCATTQDVRILDREIRRLEFQWTQTQNRDLKEKEELRKELSILRGELSPLKQEVSSLRSDLSSETQKLKADLLLRMESLQTETRILSTGIEEYKEYLRRPTREVDRLKGEVEARVRALEEKGKSQDEHFREMAIRMKGIEEQLKTIEARWRGHEDRLKTNEDRLKGGDERLKGIEERIKGIEAKLITKPPEAEKPPLLEEKVSDWKSLSARIGDLYREAYETFQKGDLEGARKKFEAFLTQYPHTELSDNAQFWIGETYFLKKDYEKAILEYEKVMVKYPEGDKVPSALLKQGLAFLELGDKTNARSLLRRVVERYPKTEQAEIAKKRLESIK